MLLERGPWAFVVGVARLLRASVREESVAGGLSLFISTRISARVAVLTTVQCRLATLLGVVSAQKNPKDEWERAHFPHFVITFDIILLVWSSLQNMAR